MILAAKTEITQYAINIEVFANSSELQCGNQVGTGKMYLLRKNYAREKRRTVK